mmetsp:Transcript_10224/g.23054  ORF Transcript_10224/g.23054 Transcript_10224/m.23054 type:complete len:303 (+) Transcript_10224:358-1266(+)
MLNGVSIDAHLSSSRNTEATLDILCHGVSLSWQQMSSIGPSCLRHAIDILGGSRRLGSEAFVFGVVVVAACSEFVISGVRKDFHPLDFLHSLLDHVVGVIVRAGVLLLFLLLFLLVLLFLFLLLVFLLLLVFPLLLHRGDLILGALIGKLLLLDLLRLSFVLLLLGLLLLVFGLLLFLLAATRGAAAAAIVIVFLLGFHELLLEDGISLLLLGIQGRWSIDFITVTLGLRNRPLRRGRARPHDERIQKRFRSHVSAAHEPCLVDLARVFIAMLASRLSVPSSVSTSASIPHFDLAALELSRL